MAKAVRMSDIAERLHVSIVTVSKALAGKDGVSEELRQEILQLAEEMGYQSKKFKPAATGKTYTLGIVTSYRYIEKGQSFYWNLYERILFYLAQTGHIGILEVVTDSAEQERQFHGWCRKNGWTALLSWAISRSRIGKCWQRPGFLWWCWMPLMHGITGTA